MNKGPHIFILHWVSKIHSCFGLGIFVRLLRLLQAFLTWPLHGWSFEHTQLRPTVCQELVSTNAPDGILWACPVKKSPFSPSKLQVGACVCSYTG